MTDTPLIDKLVALGVEHCEHAGTLDGSKLIWLNESQLRALVDAETKELRAQRDSLLGALAEITDRLRTHPVYADLTEEQEEDCGGDAAEFSYLVRIGSKVIAELENPK